MSGHLRIAEWRTAPLLGDTAHAFAASGPQRASLCDTVPWRPTLVPADTTATPCRVCREIVAGAAFRALEEIAGLEQCGPVIGRATA